MSWKVIKSVKRFPQAAGPGQLYSVSCVFPGRMVSWSGTGGSQVRRLSLAHAHEIAVLLAG